MLWSPQQDAALKAVGQWIAARDYPYFYLAGYAGTGKTTLAIEMANLVPGDVRFASFTGKAALVMRRKGCWDASTIHSMIYEPREDEEGNVVFRLNPKSDLHHASLIIIDEVSMVNEEIGRDLLSFRVPILVIGDPAQLPPVNGEGFFTRGDPDVMLTEIHRQAAGNPILALATKAREGVAYLPFGTTRNNVGAACVTKWANIPDASKLAAGQIIVGTNSTRRKLNGEMRALLRNTGSLPRAAKGVPDWMPVVGEKVICLRNNRDLGLFNGGLWRVEEVHDGPPLSSSGQPRKKLAGILYLRISSLDDEDRYTVDVEVPQLFFQGREDELTATEKQRFQQFDFGYAITAHKSQGSQWENVLVRDQGFIFKDMMHRWRYTALTRAAEKLIVGI